eukprot:gene36389-4083_t
MRGGGTQQQQQGGRAPPSPPRKPADVSYGAEYDKETSLRHVED